MASTVGSKPNILWIYVEDTNAWMGAYGDHTVPTPNIDSLASTGVRFDQAIMPAPVCSATRSALITGSMQTTLGLHNHRSARTDVAPIYLPQGHKTIPELFREHGYATFNIGKDDYNFVYERARLYSEHPGPLAGHQGSQDGPDFDWAGTLKDRPFFGQIQLRGGKHKVGTIKKLTRPLDRGQVTLPPYYPDIPALRDAWAEHYDTIVVTDHELGAILGQLEDNGLLANTAVFFFSDHGMKLYRHKQFLYEGGVKVPFIVNWPAGSEQLRKLGAERAELVAGLNIGTSSLALAGIPIPGYMEGIDLFAEGYRPQAHVVSARDRCDFTFDRIRSVRTERFRYIRNYMPERGLMQPSYRDKWPVTKDYRAAYQAGLFNVVQAVLMADSRPEEELYDLQADPHQIHNLAGDPAQTMTLETHRRILDDWIEQTGDKGQYPESDAGVAEVLGMYGEKCAAPECEAYRAKHGELPGQ